jgi:hypothetical protein
VGLIVRAGLDTEAKKVREGRPYVSPSFSRFVTSTLKMETVYFSETLATAYETTPKRKTTPTAY